MTSLDGQEHVSQPSGDELQPLPTRHAPDGQSDGSSHEPGPLQVTSHEQALLHLVRLPHAPAPLHVTSQS